MLIDLLGEGWRNEPRRSEIMGLGIGEGKELSTIDFILNETYGDNDPSFFAPQSTMNAVTDGATGARLNPTPCRDTFGLDEESCEGKSLSLIMEEITQRIGEGEEPEEELGLEIDEFKYREWRKPGIVYHNGVTDIKGNPSEEWASFIKEGKPRKELTELESEILLKQIIDESNLSEPQMNVILSISEGIAQVEYAKSRNITPASVRKTKQRVIETMRKTVEKLGKKAK